MADVTLAEALDNLAEHLLNNTSVVVASRMTLSQARAETNAPYIGVINNNEDINVRDPYSDRTFVTVVLHVVTKEQETGLEELKQEIKDALRTASLGDNIFGVEYDGGGITAIEDFWQADASKYSGTEMEVTLQYSDNVHNVPLPTSGSGVSEISVFKIQNMLTSGSIADNVYNHHDVSNIQLDAITIDANNNADSADDRSFVPNFKNMHINHQLDISIRYHNSYNPGSVNHATIRNKVDAIFTKCKQNYDLGNFYYLVECVVVGYDLEFPESATKGGQINIRVDKSKQYLQET